MPIVLIRRPRSAKRQHEEILKEVVIGYNDLADRIIATLNDMVANWSEKPEFKKKIIVSRKKWSVEISYDRTSRIGEIFGWVDEGTAERGGKGSAYDIYPKRKKALAFDVPYSPKSTPGIVGIGPGVVLSPGDQVTTRVVTQHVKHRGITPRHFTSSVRKQFYSRTAPGAFRSVSEAAIKRGLRKIGKRT